MTDFAKDPETGRFLTGNIGGGRPKGSRNKLSEAFVEALHDSFLEHGPETIEAVRAEKPDQYLKVIASLCSKDVNLNINNAEELTDDELRERVRTLTSRLTQFVGGVEGAGDTAGASGSAQVSARVH